MEELKKTHASMVTWLVRKVTTPLPQLEPKDMDYEDKTREEKLARVEKKRLVMQ